MKKLFWIILIMLVFACFSISLHADTTQDYYDALEKSIPSTLDDFYSDKDLTSPISTVDFIEYLLSYLKNYILSPLTLFFEMLVIIIVCSVFHSFSYIIKNKSLVNIFELSVNICATLSIVTNVYDCICECEIYLKQITDFSISLSPIVSGLCVLGGNVTAATVIGSGITLFVGICQVAFILILFPLIKMLFSFLVVSSFNNGGLDSNGLVIVIKKIFSTILGFIVMFYSAVVSCQNFTSSATDSIGARTLRFTIGNIVPVVGASLGEAVRSVGGALSVLRQSVGGVGIAVVLLLVLPCIVRIVLHRLVFWLLSVVARMLMCKDEAAMIDNIDSVYGLTLALVVCSAIMLIFLLSVFSNLSTII